MTDIADKTELTLQFARSPFISYAAKKSLWKMHKGHAGGSDMAEAN